MNKLSALLNSDSFMYSPGVTTDDHGTRPRKCILCDSAFRSSAGRTESSALQVDLWRPTDSRIISAAWPSTSCGGDVLTIPPVITPLTDLNSDGADVGTVTQTIPGKKRVRFAQRTIDHPHVDRLPSNVTDSAEPGTSNISPIQSTLQTDSVRLVKLPEDGSLV
jgi:hypothetical protein